MSLDLDLFRDLERGVVEELERHAAELVSGNPADWTDYRYRVGYMKGLRDALAIAEQAQERILGGKRRKE